MVITGNSRGNGFQLGNYLLDKAENECIQVFDIRGTSQPHDLKLSLLEMSLTSELTKSDKGLYHAQINPAYGEDKNMRPEDWLRAADILEEELNLKDQKRVMVLHEKKGRIHAHVVWERYDHTKGIMISDSFSRLAQDRARKRIEMELEQKPTPERNKNRPEMKELLSDLWGKAATGAEFIKESVKKGYTVAKGHIRRPFMVVDETGRSFDLVRQLEGVRTKEVREKLRGNTLPTEKEVIRDIRTQQKEQEVVKEKPSIPAPQIPVVQQYEQEAAKRLTETREEMKQRFILEMQEQLERQCELARQHGRER